MARIVKKIWILHPNMNIGGAETQLVHLIKGLADSKNIDLTVAFYDATGPLMDQISDLKSVNLIDLKRSEIGRLRCFFDLLILLRRSRPDVFYTLLIGPNILSGLLSFLSAGTTWIWGNRVSWFEKSEFGLKGKFALQLAGYLVKRSSLLISNSTVGEMEWQRAIGTPKRTVVIPNGIDIGRYQFDKSTRSRVRKELDINSKFVFGQIARVVPWKGYEIFLRAAALLLEEVENVSFVCVGGGDQEIVEKYHALSHDLGLLGRVHWLGERSDVADLLCAMDIVTLASTSGEGFPNIIGEAMSASRAIVATNVGEIAEILGDTGIILEQASPDKLASAWRQLLDDPSRLRPMGVRARERLVSRYSIEQMVASTAEQLICVSKI